MRAVVQRVSKSRVEVKKVAVGSIGPGLLVYLGVWDGDREADCRYLADKIAGLRIFPNHAGQMNRSLLETGGSILVVSQFTLCADCRKGRRPSFSHAAPPDRAEALYRRFVEILSGKDLRVETGRFQEIMEVYSVNDGPVTFLLDSAKAF